MRWTIIYRSVAIFLLLAIVALLVFVAFPGIRGGAGFTAVRDALPNAPSPLIAPADVVTIVLTAATIVLAGVAFVISLLAFIGYEQMRRMVETKAADIASKRIDAYIRATRDEVFQAGGLDDAAAVDRMAAALAGTPTAPLPVNKEANQ